MRGMVCIAGWLLGCMLFASQPAEARIDEMKGELARITAALEKTENLLAERKRAFEKLLETEAALRETAAGDEADIGSLEEILRASAGEIRTLLAQSLTGPEYPDRKARIDQILLPDRMPGMADIAALADICFEEMAANGQVRRGEGKMIGADGAETAGTVVRVGGFTAFFEKEGAVGYLRRDPELAYPAMVPGTPPWGIRRAIRDYFDGESEELPLDLSRGVIAAAANRESDWRAFLSAGGPLVWPILFIGLLALILFIERFFSLLRIPARTDRFMERLRELAADRQWSQCLDLCRSKQHIPVCNVLAAGIEYRDAGAEVLETALEEAVLREMPRLERFLTTLGVLAAVAPLLGLLGTVTGMIHTFQGITLFGAGDPRMMSGGISEALITTQLGLAVAIPIMIAHHFCDRRVEKITGDMEEKGTALEAILLRMQRTEASP